MSSIACAILTATLTVDGAATPALASHSLIRDLDGLNVGDRYTLDPVTIFEAASAVPLPALAALPQPDEAPALEGHRANLFGKADSLRWTTTIGYGTNFKDNALVRAGVGVSYFLVDDFSVDFELNGLYFDQELNDEVGLELNLLLRWHFHNDDLDRWSLYWDGGVGLALATGDTPEDGGSFNFTPQLGLGASFDLDGAGGNDNRLLTGVRWHHVSNANTRGENPGLDELLIYVGLDFPF